MGLARWTDRNLLLIKYTSICIYMWGGFLTRYMKFDIAVRMTLITWDSVRIETASYFSDREKRDHDCSVFQKPDPKFITHFFAENRPENPRTGSLRTVQGDVVDDVMVCARLC